MKGLSSLEISGFLRKLFK